MLRTVERRSMKFEEASRTSEAEHADA